MSNFAIKGRKPEHAILLQDPALSGIPCDVTFEIAEEDSTLAEGRLVKREIKAHKCILAACSSVFMHMFYGPMKETKKVIEVKETTFEAFKKMIEYVYNVDIECKEIGLQELYDIVNLAELYDLPKLTEELKTQMENIPLSMDNLMEVASTASEFSQFVIVSNALLMSCAKFLQKKFSDPADRLEFALNQHASGNVEVAMELLALVKQLPPLVECSNCKGKPCMKEQVVPHSRMRSGLLMKMMEYYPKAHTKNLCHSRDTNVTVNSVFHDGRVTVTNIGDNPRQVTYSSSWENEGDSKMTFSYSCPAEQFSAI